MNRGQERQKGHGHGPRDKNGANRGLERQKERGQGPRDKNDVDRGIETTRVPRKNMSRLNRGE